MKHFDVWNHQKKEIDAKEHLTGIKERDVVFIHMGQNIGFEQNGKGEAFLRPVIVLHVFNRGLFFGVPLTSKSKTGDFFETVHYMKNGATIENTAILIQAKSYSAKRVKYKTGYLPKESFESLKEKVTNRLTLSNKREPLEGINA